MGAANLVNRNTIKLSVLFTPVFLGLMLFYPNLILHYSYETKYFIKYPIMIAIILLSALYGFKKLNSIDKRIILFIFLFSLNYSLIQGQLIHQYFVQGVTLILLVALFIRFPSLMWPFLRVGIIVSVIFSVQTVVVFICWAVGYRIPVELVVFQNEEYLRTINIYLGNNGYFRNMEYGFRANSYFTEAGRFSYFLTPSFFITFSLRKQRIYRYLFILIAIALILTFSFMALIAISVSLFILCVNSYKNMRTLSFFCLLFGSTVFIYSMFNDVAIMTLKSGSLNARVLGLMHGLEVFQQYPFGLPFDSKNSTSSVGSYLTIIWWLIHTGLQGVLLLLGLLAIYLRETFFVFVNGNTIHKAIACGYLAFFLEQSLVGNYFQYYFVALTAVVISLSYSIKKRGEHNLSCFFPNSYV
jgi:hypothetical protein